MMQAVLHKWKSAFVLKEVVVQSSTTSTRIPHLAYFHSTAPCLEKWKPKWKYSDKKRACEQQSKSYIRYATRQKRADAKKALKDVLFRNGHSKLSSESFPEMNKEWEEDYCSKKPRPKASARHESRKMKAKRQLKQRREEQFFELFDENPNIFQAKYGDKWYTWAFRTFEHPYQSFEWKEGSKWSRRKLNESDIESESDSESSIVSKNSDRLVLGLPANGPLKIDDVKNAFRLAALKWHPDRHQSSTQASAAEKFKRCVDAYESLCDALSTA